MNKKEMLNQDQVSANTPPPVIEKVSKKTIKQEVRNNSINEIDGLIREYLALTPEEKQVVKNNLFRK